MLTIYFLRLKIKTVNSLLGKSGTLPPEKYLLKWLCYHSDGRLPALDCVKGSYIFITWLCPVKHPIAIS